MQSIKVALTVCFIGLLSACAMQPSQTFQQELLGSWLIEMIKDKPVVDYSAAKLQFGADNKLAGNATCNNMFGDYTSEGNSVTLNPVGLTRKSCLPALNEQENRMVEAMKEVATGRIENNMLYLDDAEGNLVFKAAPSVE